MAVELPLTGAGDETAIARTREPDGLVTGEQSQVVEIGIPGSVKPPTRVLTGLASQLLLPANPKRGRLSITNEADAWLYLRYGASAAAANDYHRRIPPQAELVLAGEQLVTSEIRCALSVGTGVANLAEEEYP